MSDAVEIYRLTGEPSAADVAQVDAIFFAASGRRSFASPEERAAFRERWLGRYLLGGSDVVLVARGLHGDVAGYLVGALDDPAGQDRFTDIDYFRGAFRELARRYPAHLHINLAPAFRNRGIGARLIGAFEACAVAAGVPGLHVVTAREARNVRFYARCGLVEADATCWNDRAVVFLAKPLGSVASSSGP
ncbi:MAG TPA: GNAT family N-acetyltransferase [Hyphomicrobiaceae bacterium]|nr:GNAT family N-acetyltransferase [Hyphomicrobiaceae bacterium]